MEEISATANKLGNLAEDLKNKLTVTNIEKASTKKEVSKKRIFE